MLGPNSGIVRRYVGLAAAVLLVAGVVACAASKGKAPSGPEVMNSGFGVSVETLGGSTVVHLTGLDQPVFTAFAQGNPNRVMVDLASVPPVEPMEPMTVQDGLVEQVSVSAFATGIGDAMTRVEVLLAVPADFKVVTRDGVLSVEIVPLTGNAGTEEFGDETLGDDPWAMEMESPAESEPSITWNAPEATRLLGVDVEETGDGALIHLRGDGSIDRKSVV